MFPAHFTFLFCTCTCQLLFPLVYSSNSVYSLSHFSLSHLFRFRTSFHERKVRKRETLALSWRIRKIRSSVLIVLTPRRAASSVARFSISMTCFECFDVTDAVNWDQAICFFVAIKVINRVIISKALWIKNDISIYI